MIIFKIKSRNRKIGFDRALEKLIKNSSFFRQISRRIYVLTRVLKSCIANFFSTIINEIWNCQLSLRSLNTPCINAPFYLVFVKYEFEIKKSRLVYYAHSKGYSWLKCISHFTWACFRVNGFLPNENILFITTFMWDCKYCNQGFELKKYVQMSYF